MIALKFDVLDMIREPDNYTSAERAQGAEAVQNLLWAAHAFPADPEDVRDWHPTWRDKMVALIKAGRLLRGGAA